jgi:peptide/nickel transport system substrate-binding protein
LAQYIAHRPSLGAVIYNWSRDSVSFFRDPRMRRSLFESVDRGKIITQTLPNRAVVADSPILPDSWAYNPQAGCPAYDPNAAKSDLSLVQVAPSTSPLAASSATESAGPVASPAPSDYKFQVMVNNDSGLAALADGVVSAWQSLGLSASVVVVDGPTFKERLDAGEFDAALVELNLFPGSDPDPYSIWRLEPSQGGLNFGRLNERSISDIVEQARREAVNSASRTDLYKQFQQIFCARSAALLLYYPVYIYAVDTRIDGIQLGFMSSPDDRFRTIKDWHFITTRN